MNFTLNLLDFQSSKRSPHSSLKLDNWDRYRYIYISHTSICMYLCTHRDTDISINMYVPHFSVTDLLPHLSVTDLFSRSLIAFLRFFFSNCDPCSVLLWGKEYSIFYCAISFGSLRLIIIPQNPSIFFKISLKVDTQSKHLESVVSLQLQNDHRKRFLTLLIPILLPTRK